MADHPHTDAWDSGIAGDIRDTAETYFPSVALSITDITGRNLARTKVVHLIRAGSYDVYHYDASNTDAEDGTNVIWDSADRPFVRRGSGSGVMQAHAAGTFSGRSSYNAEESPREDGSLFIYLSTDGDGGSITDPVLFAKLSDGNSWSDPIEIRGPAGATGATGPAGSVTYASQSEVQTGTEAAKSLSPANAKYIPGAAKAWVSFNGTGTVAINASHNVSSITDEGAGEYTIVFDIDFANTNYAACLGAVRLDDAGGIVVRLGVPRRVAADKAVGSYRMATTNTGATASDHADISAAFFGTLTS